jgi:hypothetical protein
MTYDQAVLTIIHDLTSGKTGIQTDNQGQLVIYSGLFFQRKVLSSSPNAVEETPDPNWED